MTNSKNSKIFIIIAMFLFGTIGLFVRIINLSSGEIALFRSLIATIVIIFYLLVTKQKIFLKLNSKDLILILISGVAIGINWVLLFESYKYTTISIATLTYYFAPIIVTVLCPLIFKEKMKFFQWICFLISTIGLVLITGIGDVSQGNNHLVGVGFGLGAAIVYACIILLNKKIEKVDAIHRTLFQFLSSLIILLPYVMVNTGFEIFSITTKGLVSLITIGIIHTGVAYCLYFTAVKNLTGQNVAILSYIDPLVAVILSVAILNETMTLMQIIGGILIITFTLWNEIINNKTRKEIIYEK